MENSVSQVARPVNWMRIAARVLVVSWAGCWTLFLVIYLVSGLSKPLGPEGLVGYAFIAMGLVLVIVPT